ncbi:cyclase dehydrase [Siccirubricoccus sp. KC 17139]|uniref:Cyclase dehydrase n=1 Tax=Siccirubricoccus soli TaxID=2899147 RepID=A0ABT1D3F8_9PROT|nr:cyclase dehydrase [Siccirubricoccus soli]MCO6416458.1 cyclase dehydrase [Siccirubricoccus soli]MCP2682592.1 cyclase dehydrase [Siccirubricoccus soli]
MASGLGWFSIGLGLVELLAPQAVSRVLGLRGQERLVAAYGAREVATGVGLLLSRDPEPWLWGRVAGDALDLGTLATALDRQSDRREEAGLAMLAVLGVTALDLASAWSHASRRRGRAAARRRLPDYARRSGLPASPEKMRGAARDFVVPEDFRTPAALRAWGVANEVA